MATSVDAHSLDLDGYARDNDGSNRAVAEVLAAWRAAERELAVADEDSPARERLQATVMNLRALYQRLFDERSSQR